MKNKNFTKDYKKYPVQYYPLCIKEYFFEKAKRIPMITKKTKIVSMGSCFALHIASYLKKHNYNYLVGEKFFRYLTSADWDMVFNTSSMRQIFQYSFEDFSPIVRWWDRGGVMDDPFRRQISYKKGEHERKLKNHVSASHEVLSKAEVIVLTLGLVEIWRDKRDLATFWRTPPINILDKKIHEFHVMNVNECLEDLDEIHKILSKHNPNCKIIISVSPVAIRATFRTDIDPVSANFYSKATLRSAAGMFADKHENVFYFPSFEFVVYGFPEPFQKRDNMHVKQDVINVMMRYFERRYVI